MTEEKLSSTDFIPHFKNKDLKYDNVAAGREMGWMTFSEA